MTTFWKSKLYIKLVEVRVYYLFNSRIVVIQWFNTNIIIELLFVFFTSDYRKWQS